MSLFLTACGPAAIVGAVGSAITRNAYKNDAKVNNYSQANQRGSDIEIAIANMNLGIAYMREGHLEEALERLNHARDVKPDYPPIYNALGVLHQTMREYDIAEYNFKIAIELNPDDSSALNNYGLLLCRTRRYEEADEVFLRAASNPLYATPELAYNNAGTCALNNGQIELAEKYFNEALRRNPRVGATLIQMAEISYEQGNYMPAREYLDRYLESNNHSAKSLWLGIQIERELGDKDAVSSYVLLLRNQYSESEEAKLLSQTVH
jgi:type IV pilus assembly protein PilF